MFPSNVWVDVLEHQPTDSQVSQVCLLVLPRLGGCAPKNTWREKILRNDQVQIAFVVKMCNGTHVNPVTSLDQRSKR